MARKTKKEKVIKPSEHQFDPKIENALASRIVSQEYQMALTNANVGNNDYQSYLDMLSCERNEKKYDWRSDVSVPTFTTLWLMQQGLSATQSFSTRDFTEVYIGDSKVTNAAKAEKRLINNTLNQRELYYYQKLLRANGAKDLDGAAYFRCWWEQKTVPGIVGTEIEQRDSESVDIHGDPLIDRAKQIAGIEFFEVPLEGEVPIIDRFNFDIIDRRDIFSSAEYTYSIQQDKWTIMQYNATITWMEDHADEMGFFNLDILRNTKIRGDTRGEGTHTDDFGIPKGQESGKVPIKDWLIVERYGDDWVIIKEDEEGNQIGIEPGIDDKGNQLEGAVLISVISAFAVSQGHKILVRFQQNPYRSATGESYIPLIRGLCYIHPSKKDGVGDGKCSRELQIAVDDTVNISNDRVMLGTLMTFVGRKGAVESNDTIFMEPGHVITVEDTEADLKELKIESNVGDAMAQAQFLTRKMEQLQATNPAVPSPVQTATSDVIDEQITTVRNQFKQMTFSNTFYNEFYWMIAQMTWQFAFPETLTKLIGEDMVEDFNPSLAYAYKPITSAIETEHGKAAKIRTNLQWGQVIATIENPRTPALLNLLISESLKLQGAEWEQFAKFLLDESVGGGGGGSTTAIQGAPTSNEQGFQQSNAEIATRENASFV